MTTTTGTTGITRTGVDDFVETLRAHSRRYHDQHPFHVRMNTGRLSRRQIQGWVANRFYYQENIPRKDAAILANCPDLEARRRWIRRIVDHDGTTAGEGGIEAWLRLGEAAGLTRFMPPDSDQMLSLARSLSRVNSSSSSIRFVTTSGGRPK